MEECVLDQSRLPVLPEAVAWECRYCDTNHELHPSCLRTAIRLLEILGLPPLSSQQTEPQQGADCSWYTLWHMELECRCQRGEGFWTVKYEVSDFRARLRNMRERLLEHGLPTAD